VSADAPATDNEAVEPEQIDVATAEAVPAEDGSPEQTCEKADPANKTSSIVLHANNHLTRLARTDGCVP